MKESLQNIGDLIAEPTAAFSHLKVQPRSGTAYIVTPKILMFLSHINLLSLWMIAVMAIAIAVFADMEKNKARVAALILWGLSILPEVVFAT